MVITFEKEYLRELYEVGKCNDKYCIDALAAAPSVETLYQSHALHYEVLKGNKAGISSIRVNKQYRIEFTVRSEGVEPVITICNIIELSNHYK